MNVFRLPPIVAIICALCVLGACTENGSSSASGDGGHAAETSPTPDAAEDSSWVDNGASACDRYLTPEVVGAIFKDAHGHSNEADSQSCTFETTHRPHTDFSAITIYLQNGGADTFAMDPMTKSGTPLQGIGDNAVSTAEGGVHSIKDDHICNVYVKPPFGNKLSGEPLAQKLGEVCNKLFALP